MRWSNDPNQTSNVPNTPVSTGAITDQPTAVTPSTPSTPVSDYIMQLNYDLIKPEQKSSSPRNTGNMQIEQCTEIVKDIKGLQNFSSNTDAFVTIAGLCQVGGTNRNAGRRVTYTYKGITLNGNEFSTTCSKRGGTPRQFVRTMATQIANIALRFKEPGDFSRQMKTDLSNINEEQAIWCSNFQT
jgi:ribosomal protein L11